MHIMIDKKRINNLNCIAQFDHNKIRIGVSVLSNEAEIVGLTNVGDTILPSSEFGNQCKKNAYGYSYADKSKPKESRTVSTFFIYLYGNKNRSQELVDISRMCYPKVEIMPYDIHLFLMQNGDERYVVVDLTDEIRNNHLKEAINIMLEIYGYCYVFDDEIKIDDSIV